jgi:hypothetical protein
MKLSDLPSKMGNVWVILAVLLAVGIFLISPWGLNFRAFMLGNPCAAGQIFDKTASACVPSSSQLACGGGMYLSFSQQKGYSCEWMNLTLACLLVIVGMAVWYLFMAKKASQWIAAKEALRISFEKGHLQTKDGRNDFIAVWSHVEEVHQVKPHDAWLFVGDFVHPGGESSALIIGTDKTGWVLRQWRYQLVDRQIQILSKKGMELDKALSEVAAYRARTKAMVDTVKEEVDDE